MPKVRPLVRFVRVVLWVAIALVAFSACTPPKPPSDGGDTTAGTARGGHAARPAQPAADVEVPELGAILDSNKVSGSILVYDATADRYSGVNLSRADSVFIPASTFKIPNSIIGMETGVVADRNSLFRWDGRKRRRPEWERDLTLAEAYTVSCVPCYQEVARKVGPERMREYLRKLGYGHMVFADSMVDRFWLEGDSRISQREQIDFLRRLHNRRLPISEHTYEEMRAVMLLETDSAYTLRGKTGWSTQNGVDVGWFVGFVETRGRVYYVATNIAPRKGCDMDEFSAARLRASMSALRLLRIIP